jgi:hypothetical protein
VSGRLARILAVFSEDTFNSIAGRSRSTDNNQQYDTSQVPLTLHEVLPNSAP